MQVMLCQIVTIVRPIAEAEDRRRVRAVVQLARHVLAVHRATAGVNLILFVRCLCETSRQEPERRELRVSVHWHVADPLFQSPLGVQTNERHRVCQSALFPRWILSQRGRKNQPGCRMKHKAPACASGREAPFPPLLPVATSHKTPRDRFSARWLQLSFATLVHIHLLVYTCAPNVHQLVSEGI